MARPAAILPTIMLGWTLLLSGCGYLETRPGHPDSYNAKFNSYYDAKAAWNESTTNGKGDAEADGPPPVFVTSAVPADIWKARGYGQHLHLQYAAAAAKAQDLQDELTIPLFGAAIAAGAVALAHASTVAIAITGLAGTSAGAAYSYSHPGDDAATDLAADGALVCVLDQSHILRHMNAIPLVLDRAALRDALSRLARDAGGLANRAEPNAAEQKGIAAVAAAQSAAEGTVKSLNSAIAAYNGLPSAIYAAVDAIDLAAKTKGSRTTDFSAILKQVKASATTEVTADMAKDGVQVATNTAAAASASTSTDVTKVAQPPALTAASRTPTPALDSVTRPVTPGDTARTALAANPTAGTAADTTQQKTTSLRDILDSDTLSDLAKVNQLATVALDDLPMPSFSDIATNIAACSEGRK